MSLTLQADSTAQHGRTVDEAVKYINQQIQASSNADLKKVLAHGPPGLISQNHWDNARPFVVLSPQYNPMSGAIAAGGGCPAEKCALSAPRRNERGHPCGDAGKKPHAVFPRDHGLSG